MVQGLNEDIRSVENLLVGEMRFVGMGYGVCYGQELGINTKSSGEVEKDGVN